MSDEEQDGFSPELWTFGGSRVDGKGRRYHAWLPAGAEPDDELYYPPKGGRSVGAVYEVMVRRQGDKTTMQQEVTYRHRNPDAELCALLEARHRAAEVKLTSVRIDRNDAKRTELDAMLEPLEAVMRKLPSMERDAYLAYVMRRLSRAW